MTPAILDHLWQSTLIALGIGFLTMAFRRARADVRYALWFVASAKFLVPFAALAALGRTLPLAVRSPIRAPEASLIERATQPFSQVYAAVPPVHTSPHFDPASILIGLWGLGCAAVLIGWMVRWRRVRSIVRSATPASWPGPMPVLSSHALLEPGLVGFWRPVLLVPNGLRDHIAQPEIDAIVAHEASHLRRRDNLTAAVHTLVEAIFWFHPLVWWIGARLIEEREMACDEAVVRSGHDRAAYAKSILEICRLYLQSPLPCVVGASGSNLKKRVEMIMNAPLSPPLSPSKKALLLAAGICAFASPVAAGLVTSPALPATVRVTQAVSSPSPARPGEARPAETELGARSAPRHSEAMQPIRVAWSEAAPGPDRSVVMIDSSVPPAAQDTPAPPAEQTQTEAATGDASHLPPGSVQSDQPDDKGKSPTSGQAASRQPPEFSHDKKTEAHCYIVFGDLRCDRAPVSGPQGG